MISSRGLHCVVNVTLSRTGSGKRKREPPQISRLKATIQNLESKLATSLPKAEAEALRTRITELESKLNQSISKVEVDNLKNTIQELEARLSESKPKVESESKIKELETKIQELETKLAESIPKTDVDALRTTFDAKVRELETKLEESIPKTEVDTAKAQFEAKIRDLETKLAEYTSTADAFARKLLSPVPQDKAFTFHLDMNTPTGKTANSLQAFCESLLEVEPNSITFHLEREDFQNWVNEVIGDKELAPRLSSLKGLTLSPEELKSKVYDVVKTRCDELSSLLTKDQTGVS